MFKHKRKLGCVFLLMMLCLAAGPAGAEEDLLWPVKSDLVCKNWSLDEARSWVKVGDVKIWNTDTDLNVQVTAIENFKIATIQIHVAMNDTDEFVPILNKKSKPIPGKFIYKTEYPGLTDEHSLILPISDLDVCWGMPEKCPLNRYIIIHAELVKYDETTGKYENIGEGAYGLGNKTFSRVVKGDTNLEGTDWGYYYEYPLAKVEPGHFIDANVNGLAFLTPTQSGTTGDNGQFRFIPGERVYFFVGSLNLGDALADRSVSPADLFAGADMDDNRVINMAWLLQSLDADGMAGQGAINITQEVVACLEDALEGLPPLPDNPAEFFTDETAVGALIQATQASCSALVPITREEAWENLSSGQKAANLMKKNVSKNPDMKSDKAKIEIMPVYVPAQRSDNTPTTVVYHDADGNVIEERNVAKPVVVAYIEEVEGTGASDVFVAVSRDDGDTWKRRNISRTADKSSKAGCPGDSQKPMLNVKDNKILVAWTDKFCRGGRPRYAITVCPDLDEDGSPDESCEICQLTSEGEMCRIDYSDDDAFYQEDLYGASGPQRSVIYEEYPEKGEVAYSCVWAARGIIDPDTGEIMWFKPERLTSGRRDAFQLNSAAADDAGFALVWQEDPKGLVPGEGDGPGEGWSGANTHSKSDIWYSFIKWDDFDRVSESYDPLDNSANIVDRDPDVIGRLNALVPMSIPVKITDNDVCSLENMVPGGGNGEHDYDGEGEGTHCYCGDVEAIGTAESPGSNPLCAYTVPVTNPKGEVHNVCVTTDGRLLDGDTGASRPNLFLQPYMKPDGSKSAWAILGYEESKGVGIPPEGEHDDDHETADGISVIAPEEGDDGRYKPDVGKNVIYHSFEFSQPATVDGGGILNQPETDADGNPVYLVDEFGQLLLDWKGNPQLAYENARRVRFLVQPKSKAGASKTVLVTLYRQGEEGSGKPADIFMRRLKAPSSGNPYAFGGFLPGAQNVSSVEPTELFQDPFDTEAPVKMLRWAWSPANLADSSAKNPYTDARAHRGALNGDELIIGYTLTPNWGRKANDKYDLYVRRSFNGGQSWTTDPADPNPIEHNVVFRVPVIDDVNQTVTWDEEVVTTQFQPGASEPPRNVSNLRNNRTSVLEPRIVKTPGSITKPDGTATGYPEDIQDTSVYQVAYGLEFNQNTLPEDVVFPQLPLDIYYSRTMDKGQRYEGVIITPQDGSGKPQEGWNPLAKDKPEQGAAQVKQTPDGSRMYGIWLEEGESGSDIMFRRVDYR